MGALLALPPSFDHNSLRTALGRKLALTLKIYGAFLVDSFPAYSTSGFAIERKSQSDRTVINEVRAAYGIELDPGWPPWANQITADFQDDRARIFNALCVIANNGPTAPKGPGGQPPPNLFIPIVLSAAGKNNSFYTSELTLTNRSSQNAALNFRYTAAFGGGGGSATDALAAGRQRIIPDAISYLRSIGISIPDSGNRGGTLSVRFDGLTNAFDGAATVRTTTAVAGGSAGLAYAGIPLSDALTGKVYLCGLRQNAADRSNVALQNAGAAGSGDVVLRVTIFSGNLAQPVKQTLPDITVSPGAFEQIGEILNLASLAEGFVSVERVGGTAPYYCYAVVNDEQNSDGSFVPPVLENAMAGSVGITVPVMVEAAPFTSELVAANWSAIAKTLRCSYVAQGIQNQTSSANFLVTVGPGEQKVIGNFLQHLRDLGLPGLPSAGSAAVAGALFATVDSEDMNGIFLGARTSSPGPSGRFGVFYTGVPYGSASQASAWLYGLHQDANSRTNLALINTGEASTDADVFSIEFFNGETGTHVSTLSDVTLGAREWQQFGTVLANHTPGIQQGYAKVTRTGGLNPFIAYAVINDGGQPEQRTGDGAYVASSP